MTKQIWPRVSSLGIQFNPEARIIVPPIKEVPGMRSQELDQLSRFFVLQIVWQFVLGHAPPIRYRGFATASRCREMYLRRSQKRMLGRVQTFDSQQALSNLFIYLCQVLQCDFVFRVYLCTQTSADRPSEPVRSGANVISRTVHHRRNSFATKSNTIAEGPVPAGRPQSHTHPKHRRGTAKKYVMYVTRAERNW